MRAIRRCFGVGVPRWVERDGAREPSQAMREAPVGDLGQVTAQRLAVLRAVAGQPHIRADELAEPVSAEIGAISLQSVYDALGVLGAEALIRRIQPARSPPRFEDRAGDNTPSG